MPSPWILYLFPWIPHLSGSSSSKSLHQGFRVEKEEEKGRVGRREQGKGNRESPSQSKLRRKEAS
jgi:hypothetical protein